MVIAKLLDDRSEAKEHIKNTERRLRTFKNALKKHSTTHNKHTEVETAKRHCAEIIAKINALLVDYKDKKVRWALHGKPKLTDLEQQLSLSMTMLCAMMGLSTEAGAQTPSSGESLRSGKGRKGSGAIKKRSTVTHSSKSHSKKMSANSTKNPASVSKGKRTTTDPNPSNSSNPSKAAQFKKLQAGPTGRSENDGFPKRRTTDLPKGSSVSKGVAKRKRLPSSPSTKAPSKPPQSKKKARRPLKDTLAVKDHHTSVAKD